MTPGDIAFDPAASARPRLAEFPEAVHWVNRPEGVRLAELRGHIVLLLFWNATSASSANVLRDLRLLENRFPSALVALCVHTPRYTAQQSDAAVAQAAQRNRVRALVANDAEWLLWKQCGIGAWPTVLLLDTDGGVAARVTGEGHLQELEDAIVELRTGAPPAVPPAAYAAAWPQVGPAGPLAFPAHALATANRLYVSDTGHHRVLECGHDGRVLRQFGSGTPGNWDGQLAACGFRLPHGLALAGNALYVADTGNHCVRRIRLDEGDVDTVLGTGRAAYAPVEQQGAGVKASINSPQAVVVEAGTLYVAATGQHQILRGDLERRRVETLAGDARSDVRDGIGGMSSLAQPAALALLPGQLLVADVGGNAIRRVRLADLAVTTLVGTSPWEPGCRDGTGHAARLAFPCGLTSAGERVYVADTMNDRVCMLDPYSCELITLAIDVPLHEPQGLSFAAGSLWVAARNDHAVVRVDPSNGHAERVEIEG